jgi:hypothetical protein
VILEQSYQRYLSRLLLTFSDLAETDAEIAQCLIYMKVSPPPNETQWTAALVRRLMPEAFTTVTSASPYAINQPLAATAYCAAVHRYIKQKEINHAS